MTRKSKREIERDVADLKPQDDGTGPIVFHLTHVTYTGKQWPDMSDSPHPELTVRPRPEQSPQTLKIAVPKLLPREHLGEDILFITTCENGGRYCPNGDDSGVHACDLWGALDDEDRREEYRVRKEQDDPIPPILDDYDPKDPT